MSRIIIIISQFMFLLGFSGCIYMLPIYKGLEWGMGIRLDSHVTAIFSFGITVSLMYYFKTKTKSIVLKNIMYAGVGPCFFAFWVTVLIILGDQFISITGHLKVIFLLFGTAILVGIAKYKGRQVLVKHIEFKNSKIKKTTSIVFISDVHIGTQSEDYVKNIISKINAIGPDMVLIGGDLIDSSDISIQDLIAFKALSMPIYFITGNHEYYLKNYTQILTHLKQVHINWVDNTAVKIGELNIIGISDNQANDSKIEYIKQYLDSDAYNICLVHRPSCFDILDTKPELMLSGHTHNGQMVPFNLIVKLNFPKIYGLYRDGAARFYVSSGVGTWGNRMRLGTSNEIVVIQLAPN